MINSFVGKWVDESHHKRLLTSAAGATVALGAIGIALLPGYVWQIIAQLIIGLAITVLPAVTAAFALGMSDEGQLTKRVARNESFNHLGNVAFAAAAGVIGALVALQGIFYAAAAFALGMAPSAFFISEGDVNYEAARGG